MYLQNRNLVLQDTRRRNLHEIEHAGHELLVQSNVARPGRITWHKVDHGRLSEVERADNDLAYCQAHAVTNHGDQEISRFHVQTLRITHVRRVCWRYVMPKAIRN